MIRGISGDLFKSFLFLISMIIKVGHEHFLTTRIVMPKISYHTNWDRIGTFIKGNHIHKDQIVWGNLGPRRFLGTKWAFRLLLVLPTVETRGLCWSTPIYCSVLLTEVLTKEGSPFFFLVFWTSRGPEEGPGSETGPRRLQVRVFQDLARWPYKKLRLSD